MKVLLVTGNCPYNLYQEHCLRECGVDARIFGEWGMYLPDQMDALLGEKADIIHLQWPEAITRHPKKPASEVLSEVRESLSTLKTSGVKLFWVMHNLLPHNRENPGSWREIWQLFAEHCDVACHHSQCGREAAISTYTYGDARHEILRHGYFDRFPPCPLNETEARNQLGLPPDANIYLAVGSLRPDKNTRELIQFFGQRDPSKEGLMLAGNTSWSAYGAEMLRYAEDFENVFIDGEFITDEKVAMYAKACTAFITMYGENHLTSGSPHLSQAFLLPQISLDTPYTREVLAEGASYVGTGDDRYALLHHTLDHLHPEQLQARRQYIADHRAPWHWPRIARKTQHVYEEVLSS